MKFEEILTGLDAKLLNQGLDYSTRDLKKVIACDLMSDVLVTDSADFLLVTSLPSEQTARTADMVGAVGILLVNDKSPQPGLIKLATEMGMTLMSTPLPSFDACLALGKLLKP